MKKDAVPKEFAHLLNRESIPWGKILTDTETRMNGEVQAFEAFTDAAIALAKRECKKKKPNSDVLILGLEACIDRGKFAQGLALSDCSDDVAVLSMRAIALSTISDADGIGEILNKLETVINDNSSLEERIRLISTRILLGALKKDEGVIASIIELDSLLESNPNQLESPIPEAVYAMYVTGVLFCHVGELERALNVALFLETAAHTNDRQTVLILSENLRGRISSQQGHFHEAEIHYKRILRISRGIASRVGLGIALNNLGSLMLNAIRLEDALEYLQEAMQYLEMDAHRVFVLANMGEITTLLGRHEESIEFMSEAVKLNHDTGVEIIEPYTWMVILLTRTGNLEGVGEYLEKAKRLSSASDSPKDKAAYYHAKGVFEGAGKKTSASIKSLSRAMKIAKDNNLFEWLIRSILAIVRTYLGAFSRSKKEEYLVNSAYHLDNLIQIAKEQEMNSLRAEALLLRSEIRIHGGDTLGAEDDLERIAGLAAFLENERLESTAKQRLKSLSKPTDLPSSPDSVIDVNMDRVEGFHPVREMQDVPSPEVHALIALGRASGLPEFVHYFDEKLEMDSSILSGFISAITSFSGELMGGSGLIRSISQEGFTLMMEHTSSRIVTLIVSQETFDIRYKLHEFAKIYDETFPASYDSVVTSEYSAANELLYSIFSSNMTPDT
ncbi:MAG: hypothetical protein P1Q69_09165 [Candidatus Thorarchaeota archaeon]|nr:hypothetical protein [Candidatus Thorarchaeota archaeon]